MGHPPTTGCIKPVLLKQTFVVCFPKMTIIFLPYGRHRSPVLLSNLFNCYTALYISGEASPTFKSCYGNLYYLLFNTYYLFRSLEINCC